MPDGPPLRSPVPPLGEYALGDWLRSARIEGCRRASYLPRNREIRQLRAVLSSLLIVPRPQGWGSRVRFAGYAALDPSLGPGSGTGATKKHALDNRGPHRRRSGEEDATGGVTSAAFLPAGGSARRSKNGPHQRRNRGGISASLHYFDGFEGAGKAFQTGKGLLGRVLHRLQGVFRPPEGQTPPFPSGS